MVKQMDIQAAIDEITPCLDNSYPRNIIRTCEKLDISVMETTEFPHNISGLIYKKDNGKYCILVNSKQTAGRKAFTIAHELGHYFMHRTKLETDKEIVSGAKGIDLDSRFITRQDITADSTQEYRRLETEANKFAAEILMPKEIFLQKCMELNSIDDVAAYFGVSISAATIRADRLGGLYFL